MILLLLSLTFSTIELRVDGFTIVHCEKVELFYGHVVMDCTSSNVMFKDGFED